MNTPYAYEVTTNRGTTYLVVFAVGMYTTLFLLKYNLTAQWVVEFIK